MFNRCLFFNAYSAVNKKEVVDITKKKIENLSLNNDNRSQNVDTTSRNLSLGSRSDNLYQNAYRSLSLDSRSDNRSQGPISRSLSLGSRSDNLSQEVSSSKLSFGSQSLPYSSTRSLFERFKASMNHSQFTRNIINLTNKTFIDIPKTVIDLSSNSNNYMLALGFRFMPGQSDFVLKGLRLPSTLEGLKGLRESLGLKLAKDSLTNRGLLQFKDFTAEIHAKSSLLMNRVLLEAITYNEGFYGRFLVLVQIGIGITVWYGFLPGDGINIPFESVTNLFSPIINYEPFFYNPESYVHLGFEKMTLIENDIKQTVSAVTTAFTDEKPFMDIHVSPTSITNPYTILGTTVGLVIVVLLSVGMSPCAQ